MGKLLLLLTALLVLPSMVFAQETITLDEIKSGALPSDTQAAVYSLTIPLPGTYDITVAEIDIGLALQFTVTTSTGAPVATAVNTSADATFMQPVVFTQPGQYLLSITSASGVGGRFVALVQPGQSLPPPLPLNVGESAAGSLNGGQSHRLSFTADPVNFVTVAVIGQVRSDLADSAGNNYGQLSSLLAGGSMIVPPGSESYILTLLNDTDIPAAAFNISLNLAVTGGGGTATPPPDGTPLPESTTRPLPTLPTTGACVLATLEAVNVNVRGVPSTEGNTPVGQLSPFEVYPVIGRTGDSTWFEISGGGVHGWVAASVTRRGGDCSTVPVTFTPQPTVSPTATPRVAADGDVNTQIEYLRDAEQGYFGAVSYPAGNRQDTIAWRQTGVPALPPENSQFRYSIRCSGIGVEFAEIVFSNGSSSPCTDAPINFAQYLTTTSSRSDSVTIRLTGGDNAYVTWRILFSYYIP